MLLDCDVLYTNHFEIIIAIPEGCIKRKEQKTNELLEYKQRLEIKLANKQYIAKAPIELIEKDREQLRYIEKQLNKPVYKYNTETEKYIKWDLLLTT